MLRLRLTGRKFQACSARIASEVLVARTRKAAMNTNQASGSVERRVVMAADFDLILIGEKRFFSMACHGFVNSLSPLPRQTDSQIRL